MEKFPDLTPVEANYTEYNAMQPFEFTCPKCKNRFCSDVPQITIICKCGACLIREDFKRIDIFLKSKNKTSGKDLK